MRSLCHPTAHHIHLTPQVYEALDTDEPGDMVAYSRLFEDDENMNQVRISTLSDMI